MRTIWKYDLQVKDNQFVNMPRGARVLSVQAQNDFPCIWAEVDSEQPKEPRMFVMYGTGHPMVGQSSLYVGTFQLRGGQLVFHVYEP